MQGSGPSERLLAPARRSASAASSVKPPTKTARRRKRTCSAVVEQVVAPADRAAHRLLAQRQIARAAGQERQPLLQPRQQRLGGRGLRSGRRPARSRAAGRRPGDDLGNRRQRLGGEAEIGSDSLRALGKEPDRAGPLGVLDRGRGVKWQRSDGTLALSGDAEPDPAGDKSVTPGQTPRRWRTCGPAVTTCSKLSRSKSRRLSASTSIRRSCNDAAPMSRNPERAGDGVQDEIGIGDRGEIDEGDPVGKVFAHLGCNSNRQARLANATRARQRQESHGGITQQRDKGGHLLITRNQRRQRDWKLCATAAREGSRPPERQERIAEVRRWNHEYAGPDARERPAQPAAQRDGETQICQLRGRWLR